MNRRTKYVAWATVFVVVVGIGSVLLQGWRSMQEAAYMSCLSSLTDAVRKQEAAQAVANRSDRWTILSTDEVDTVTQNVRGGHCTDSMDPKRDLQGNRINIALRRESKENWPPIIIWSNGRDGISGTADDIVMPYGQTIPK